MSLTSRVLHPTTCLADARPGPILINEDLLKPQWNCRFKRLESPKLRWATEEVINTQGVVLLALQIEELQVQIWFGIVKTPAANVLVGTNYIDERIRVYSPWSAR